MIKINNFGIYIAKVDFEDKPGVYKVRPVLIIDNKNFICISLKITSQIEALHSKLLFLDKWEKYNLPKPSSVIIDKFFKIEQRNIYKFISILDEDDIDKIKSVF